MLAVYSDMLLGLYMDYYKERNRYILVSGRLMRNNDHDSNRL